MKPPGQVRASPADPPLLLWPNRHPKEPFQKTERRDWAETVLDNPELLLMYAQSSGDVSNQTPFLAGWEY